MNQIDLRGRVAVVTGGARGIGYAVAQRMLRSGAAVSLWDIDSPALEAAETRLTDLGRVTGVPIDLTNDDEVHKAVRVTLEQFGRIDVLINNAGITGGNAPTWAHRHRERRSRSSVLRSAR